MVAGTVLLLELLDELLLLLESVVSDVVSSVVEVSSSSFSEVVD